MPHTSPPPDPRLIALVLAALIAVLLVVTTTGSPAAASSVPLGPASQDERFQPQQERALPPFGIRTILAPVEQPQSPRSRSATTAR